MPEDKVDKDQVIHPLQFDFLLAMNFDELNMTSSENKCKCQGVYHTCLLFFVILTTLWKSCTLTKILNQ